MPICKRVEEIANKYNVTISEVALAWILSKNLVASLIIGVIKINHLEDAVRSVDLELSNEYISYCQALAWC